MKTSLLSTFALVSFAVAAPALAAEADNYPNKPVRLLVGFPPGGPADIAARVLAEGLQTMLKQPFVVENRTGAGGNIASQAVAKSPADGYILLVATASLTVNPYVNVSAGYDAVKDFTPLAIIATQANAIAVSTNSGINSVEELQKVAKTKHLTFATSGLGTSSDLTGRYLFNMKWGTDMLSVPYRGAGPAGLAVASGEPQVGFTTITGVLPLAQENRLKILAVADEKRSPSLPNVPTLGELGYKVSSSWTSLFGPANMPPAIVQKINKAVAQLTATPAFQEKLVAQQMTAADSKTSAELTQMLKEEVVAWGEVVKAAGLTKQ